MTQYTKVATEEDTEITATPAPLDIELPPHATSPQSGATLEEEADSPPRGKFLLGPHTCRSLVLAVLLLGAIALKKFQAGLREESQRQRKQSWLPKEPPHGSEGQVKFMREQMRGQWGGTPQGAAEHAKAWDRGFPGHPGQPHPQALPAAASSASRAFAAGTDFRGYGQSQSTVFSQSEPSGSASPRLGMSLVIIAVGTVGVWFLVMLGIRRLRKWYTSVHQVRGAADEETPLTGPR